MKLLLVIEFLRKNIKTLKVFLILYLIGLVLFDFFLSREHAHYFMDKVPAFWTIFGGLGCYLLIKVSKGIAHLFLSKKEEYYG